MKTGVLTLKNKPRAYTLSPVWGTFAAVAIGAFPGGVSSQPILGGGSAGMISIVPRLSVSETYTNNVFLSSGNRQADLVTEISPGIRVTSRGGRITGSLDYSLNELLYAQNSSGRRSQNALNATGTMEAIDKWGYIDFSGFVGQHAVSAFGAPANDGIALNGNNTETSVFMLSPHVKGRLGSVADYEARYSLTSSRSRSSLVSNVYSKDFSARLSGVGGRLGWSLDTGHQVIDFSAGRSTTNQRISGQLTYALDTRWGVYVKGDHESNNFVSAADQQGNFIALGATWNPNEETKISLDKDNRGSTGLVAAWAPSRRTSVSVTRERRLYGDTHSVALAYRTPNTAWTFADSRSVVANPGQSSGIGSASLYDVLYGQFAAGESDPIKRGQYDAFLKANGIKPGATATAGFLTSSVSLQRQQQLSFALLGVRNTVTVIVTRGQNSSLDTLSAAVDDFSTSPVVRQNGLSVNYSYRITANSLLSLAATRQVSTGSVGQNTSARSLNVNLTTQLSRDTSASVGARRVVFDSSTAPYTETAVLGNLSVQF